MIIIKKKLNAGFFTLTWNCTFYSDEPKFISDLILKGDITMFNVVVKEKTQKQKRFSKFISDWQTVKDEIW